MSNFPQETSKRIREKTGWSQAELADRLMISRNYVALIEMGRKQPSARLLSQLTSMLDEVEKGNSPDSPSSEAHRPANDKHRRPADVQDKASDQVRLGQLSRQVYDLIDAIIEAADHDVGRYGWILEQLRSHLQAPAHWSHSSEIHDRVLQEVLDEEKVTEKLSPSRHSPVSKRHEGAGL